MKTIIGSLFFILSTMIALAFCFANSQLIKLNVFFAELPGVPVGVLLLVMLGLGLLLGLVLGGALLQIAKLKARKSIRA